MEFIVDDISGFLEIHWEYYFVHPVGFPRRLGWGLSPMSRIMEEERVMGTRILDKPCHGVEHLFSCRPHSIAVAIVDQEEDVLRFKPVAPDDEIPYV